MKHGLATLALTEVNNQQVKDVMLKEAGALKKILSGAGREAKDLATLGAGAAGATTGAGVGGLLGLLGVGKGEGGYADNLGAMIGGGAAGGGAGALGTLLLASLLRKKLPGSSSPLASMSNTGLLAPAGGIGAGIAAGSGTAQALRE